MALLDDPRVTTLGLHVEGIGDLRGSEALADHSRALGKPIVALKIGRSEQARSAAISHTASIAGSDAGARALSGRLGIAQVASLGGLLETLKLLHVTGPLASNRIASMSCSGGEAGLIADAAHGKALVFPPLEPSQRDALRAALGPKVALANPLDYHTYIWGQTAALTRHLPRDDDAGAGAWHGGAGLSARRPLRRSRLGAGDRRRRRDPCRDRPSHGNRRQPARHHARGQGGPADRRRQSRRCRVWTTPWRPSRPPPG